MAETAALQVASSSRTALQRKQQEASDLFRPSSFAEAMEFAKVLASSGMVPKAYVGKPEAIIATWQHSLELGVGLMQGLQGIANINGTPSVFGDLGWALVQNHPDFVDSIEELTDTHAVCTLKRRGRSDKTQKYTLEDAKRNELLGKDNWKKNPRRMLQWRARSWAMRDQFPESLKGMVIVEEVEDYPGPTIESRPAPVLNEQQARATITADASGAAAEQPKDEPIGTEKASAWFAVYRAHGWMPAEAQAWLKDTLRIEHPKDSRDIPTSKYEQAMAWANTNSPTLLDISTAQQTLGWTTEEVQALITEKNKNWPAIREHLSKEIEKRDAAEKF